MGIDVGLEWDLFAQGARSEDVSRVSKATASELILIVEPQPCCLCAVDERDELVDHITLLEAEIRKAHRR